MADEPHPNRRPAPWLRLGAGVLVAACALAAAAATPWPAQDTGNAAPASGATAATTTPDALGTPFSTRYAHFEPVAFTRIPGWAADDLRSGLEVFRISCKAIAKRAAWADTCADLAQADISDGQAARRFFQAHFHAYQVFNLDHTPEGLITGYFEPQLQGSRVRSKRFRYPVYATPRDLYLLDARSLSGAERQWLQPDGQWLRAASPGAPGAHEYRIALGDERPDLADKRYRVRIDAGRVVPYWTRQDIERRGVNAQVLAWVDNAWKLYSMQIQGSGRITLDDGGTLRVAYAEQNGQPFMPNVSAPDRALVANAITTRGLGLEAGGTAPHRQGGTVADLIAQLKGDGAPSPATPARAGKVKPVAPAGNDAQVQSLVAALLGNPDAAGAQASARPVSMPRPASETRRAQSPQVQSMISSLLGTAPATPQRPADATPAGAPAASAAAGEGTGIGDPSFVFFRAITSREPGPPGALGVPLTAGRSLAVDPRTTPLGAPVFIETAAPLGGGELQRLMLAQDTGGAIRGSVRGDFFWGYGAQAGNLASAMNADGHMWLLLPRDLDVGALSPQTRTRSLAGHAPDCVIPDEVSCVE